MNQETFVAIVIEVLVIFGVAVWLGFILSPRRANPPFVPPATGDGQLRFSDEPGVASESWRTLYE